VRIVERIVLAIVIAAGSSSTALAAEACHPKSAEADALFKKGRALFDKGSVELACEALEASKRIEPSVGTLGLYAACREQQGRLAAARGAYRDAEDAARVCHDKRGAFAARRAAALEARLGRVVLRLPDEDTAVEIRRGSTLVQLEPGGRRAFVDPGLIEIIARAPGKAERRVTAHVAEGERVEIAIPALPAAPPQKAPVSGPGWRGPLAIATTGLGILGLGVGIGAGLVAIGKKDASMTYCDAFDRCAPAGGALREEGRTAAAISTAGISVGIGALAAGAILLLVDGRAAASRGRGAALLLPSVLPRGAGASFEVDF